MGADKRKFIRPDSLNLLDYLLVDQQGCASGYNMARTLNISIGGILMETHLPLDVGQHVIITLGLKGHLVDLTGKVVHTAGKDNRFQSGIEFLDVDRESRHIINEYMKEFQYRFSDE